MIPGIPAFLLELVGTVSFSVSGALVAIKARLDLFGVLFIGCITAIGGGILRDVLVGAVPPAVFSRLHFVLVGVATALAVFVVSHINRAKFDPFRERIEAINNLFDALGLGVFSVMGTEAAFDYGMADNVGLAVTMGFLTGVGGGVIRDVLTDAAPYIFKKHVYALISLAGSLLYYLLRLWLGSAVVPSMVTVALVVILRLLAARYRWSLPKIQL